MQTSENPVFKGVALVCDDNSMNLMLICEHLRLVGLEVIAAIEGTEGIEKVRKRAQLSAKSANENSDTPPVKQFDIVFMDIHMPGMDGIETASLIRKIDKNIPIVALTTDERFKHPENFEDSGIVDYLGKPYTLHELRHCLMRHLTPVDG